MTNQEIEEEIQRLKRIQLHILSRVAETKGMDKEGRDKILSGLKNIIEQSKWILAKIKYALRSNNK